MRWGSLLFLASLAAASHLIGAEPRPSVTVVVGAEGAEEFGKQFQTWASRWEAAAKQANADFTAIGLDDAKEKSDRELLTQRLSSLTSASTEPAWLVLLGHGTFDGKIARYNLRGPDFTAAQLAAWLRPTLRPLAIIAMFCWMIRSLS